MPKLTEAEELELLELERARAKINPPTEEAAPMEDPSVAESAKLGLSQGLTFGFSDEMYGAWEALKKKISEGGDFSEEYQKYRDLAREEHKRAEEANPFAYGAGQVAGGIGVGLAGGALLGGAAAAAEGAGTLATLGRVAVPAAIEGAVTSVGTSETELAGAKDTGEALAQLGEEAAVGGAIGGALGAGMHLAGKGIKAVAGAIKDEPVFETYKKALTRSRETGEKLYGTKFLTKAAKEASELPKNVGQEVVDTTSKLSKEVSDFWSNPAHLNPDAKLNWKPVVNEFMDSLDDAKLTRSDKTYIKKTLFNELYDSVPLNDLKNEAMDQAKFIALKSDISNLDPQLAKNLVQDRNELASIAIKNKLLPKNFKIANPTADDVLNSLADKDFNKAVSLYGKDLFDKQLSKLTEDATVKIEDNFLHVPKQELDSNKYRILKSLLDDEISYTPSGGMKEGPSRNVQQAFRNLKGMLDDQAKNTFIKPEAAGVLEDLNSSLENANYAKNLLGLKGVGKEEFESKIAAKAAPKLDKVVGALADPTEVSTGEFLHKDVIEALQKVNPETANKINEQIKNVSKNLPYMSGKHREIKAHSVSEVLQNLMTGGGLMGAGAIRTGSTVGRALRVADQAAEAMGRRKQILTPDAMKGLSKLAEEKGLKDLASRLGKAAESRDYKKRAAAMFIAHQTPEFRKELIAPEEGEE